MSDVLSVLASLRENTSEELVPLLYTLEDEWERKRWHQVTQALFEVFRAPSSAPLRIPLFEQFVKPLEAHLNPLAFVSFAILASEQCATPQESFDFMTAIAEKVDTDELRSVWVFATLRLASLQTQLGRPLAARKQLDAARRSVDELHITDKVILAQLYGVACEYYKTQADYTAYYRSALLYLSVIDLDELSDEAKQQKAQDLCIAALLGDKVYNFGELVLHPLLSTLQGDLAWLRELIEIVNVGDVPQFQQLRPTFTAANNLLAESIPFLEQKICLMALCETVFRRQATDRTLSFSTIAKDTYLQPGAKVEILLIKAFSLGLMAGKIDETTKNVAITWLQPRVLSMDQIATMRDRLVQWDSDVQDLGKSIQGRGGELWEVA